MNLTSIEVANLAAVLLAVLWGLWHGGQQHRKGYLLALDHVNEMMRPKKLGKTHDLKEVLSQLREETTR